MRIDSHQHFWRYEPRDYPWMTDQMSRLRRDYLPPDLASELDQAKLDGSIVVQARQTLEESRWLLTLADQYSLIKGVVGWVDLQSERVSDQLAELSRHPKFVGVRHVVQDEPDDEFMLRPQFLRGLGCLKEFDLPYDLLVYPKQLPAAIKVVERFPKQKFVLDHMGKPLVKSGTTSPWDDQIRQLGRCGNVFCKVSGLPTEAKWREWRQEDFRPYLDVVFDAFGEDRLMFGTDWPVCLLSASYGEAFGIVKSYFDAYPARIQEKAFGMNAALFYDIVY
ncbi:MAG: amidohydrolase [Verrucomicrobia bacterium]|nr:amidohydrolase [Verrucomicrobiota bacterium]